MTQTADQSEESKPLPIWISLLVILLCLGGAGWIAHWYVRTDPLSHESRILDTNPLAGNPQMGRNGGQGFRNGPPRDFQTTQAPIRQQGDSWVVHSSAATAVFGRGRNGSTLRSINYNSYEFVPEDQRRLIFAARRMVKDDAVAKSLKLTEVQVTALRPLTPQFTMVVEPADSERLRKLWQTYESSNDRQSAQTNLLDALNEIAHKSIEPTLTAANERAEKIKAVLTEDQWKEFDAMGR